MPSLWAPGSCCCAAVPEGPRLDHTASNLVILEWLSARGGRGLLLDRQNEVRLLDSETLVVPNVPPRYRYFSLIPLDRTVTGVTLEGARYPLHRAVLTRGDTPLCEQ